MKSWTGIPELRESYRALGAARFVAMMVGVLTWIGVQAWLAISLNYPRSAGSTCHRKCMIEEYWYSGALLHNGWMGVALFVLLWSMPAGVVGALIYSRIKKRRDRSPF